jgi:hypothetical protein
LDDDLHVMADLRQSSYQRTRVAKGSSTRRPGYAPSAETSPLMLEALPSCFAPTRLRFLRAACWPGQAA